MENNFRWKTYESLREELIQWQNRRYQIFTSTLVFVTALLGWFITSKNDWNYYTASILPLLIISGASYLTRNSTIYTSKIGTYFQVFYDEEWEGVQYKFTEKAKIIPTNKLFAIFYAFLAILSNTILAYETKIECNYFQFTVYIIIWLITCISIYYVGLRSYPREKYFKIWSQIKDDMSNSASQN